MRPLTPQAILTLWDRGVRLHPVERALSMLAMGCPEASARDLARLPLDERDHLLLELRVLTFGPQLEAVVACPACREWLELQLPTEELLQAQTSLTLGASAELDIDGVPIRVRMPTSEDLLAMRSAGAARGARERLLERCVEAPVELSHDQRQRALDQLVEHLPHVENAFELVCTSCRRSWR
jgi:hypothetical protein